MQQRNPFYASLAGFCMIGIGLCLCRYAYTPLIPSLIDHDWVTKAGAGYLSGFNCLGYLTGCLGGLFLPSRWGVRRLLQFSLADTNQWDSECKHPRARVQNVF